jgi:hypothetical protein
MDITRAPMAGVQRALIVCIARTPARQKIHTLSTNGCSGVPRPVARDGHPRQWRSNYKEVR